MTTATILVETHGAVTLITLNRPQSLNALNSQVLEDLIAAFAAFEADPGQRCAVLTGAGEKAFAAGADIKEMADKPAADFFAQDFFARWTSHLVKTTRKPWIAAVNGFALGGGMMDAHEAERSGLVARVVPLADLLAETLKTAAVIAAMPPLAAIANKEMVNAAFETSLDQGLVFERRVFQVLTATEDKAEGMAAFIEKRAGVFTGR